LSSSTVKTEASQTPPSQKPAKHHARSTRNTAMDKCALIKKRRQSTDDLNVSHLKSRQKMLLQQHVHAGPLAA
jgi:hypothetical protein